MNNFISVNTSKAWKHALDDSRKNFIEMLGDVHNHNILVVCCGIGLEAFLLSEKVGPDGSIIGIDINEEAINKAKSYKKKINKNNLEFCLQDANNLTFSDNSFDIIVCMFGLHYFPNAKYTFNYWKKFLKDNGQLAIASWLPSKGDTSVKKIHDIANEYLTQQNLSSNNKPNNNISQNNNDLKVLKNITLKYDIPFKNLQNYWNVQKQNDLFSRLKADLGSEKFMTLTQNIEQFIYENSEYPVIEHTRIRLFSLIKEVNQN